MARKREKLEGEVRDKYGTISGERLKKVVVEKFSEPWGPRYLRKPVEQPKIQHLTPRVLRRLLRG